MKRKTKRIHRSKIAEVVIREIKSGVDKANEMLVQYGVRASYPSCVEIERNGKSEIFYI